MNTKLKKWIKYLKTINKEVTELLISRSSFWHYLYLTDTNAVPQGKKILGHYLCSSYVSHMSMGVRRQIKINPQCISFARLLSEMIKNPEILTREYYRELYVGKPNEGKADDHFNEYSGFVFDHIDPIVPDCDLKHLRKNTSYIEKLADERIAHRDDKVFEKKKIIYDLEESIETIEILCRKYNLIFFAEHIDLLPDFHNPVLNQEIYDESLIEKYT
jgi:hypothetical protein